MTAPSNQQAPRYSSPPDPDRTFELATVRRRDVRKLAESGPPDAELPPVHAAGRDPRYPSSRRLRRVFSFVIDLVVHLVIGMVVLGSAPMDPAFALLAGVGAFFAASILDRIVLQRICRATVGKLITGLRVIRDDTGGPPTVWALVKDWLFGVLAVLFMAN